MEENLDSIYRRFIVKETVSPWPFREVALLARGAKVSLSVLEGVLPPGKTVPLRLDVKIWPVDEGKPLLFENVQVDSLSYPILLQAALEAGVEADLLVADSSRERTVYYSGRVKVLSREPDVQTAFASSDTVVVRIRDRSDRLELVANEARSAFDRPFTRLIYSLAGDAVAALDRSSYRSAAEASSAVATSVFVLDNPARLSENEKYAVLKATPPSSATLLGWSVGFADQNGGGLNIVFLSSNHGLSLRSLSDSGGASATLHNTDTAVGVFETEGTAAGANIRPLLVVRLDTGLPVALVHSPGDPRTAPALLPHNALAPVPVPAALSPLAVSVLGGSVRRRAADPPPLVAIDLERSTLLRIGRVVCDTSPSVLHVTASAPRTGLSVRATAARGKSAIVVMDGVDDDEPVVVKSVMEFAEAMRAAEGSETEVRFGGGAGAADAEGGSGRREDDRPRVVVCRTTSPPAGADGRRPPANATSIGFRPAVADDEVPAWALNGGWTGWGRHVFALELRAPKSRLGREVQEELRRIVRASARAVNDSLPSPDDYDHFREYNRGALEHAKRALGAGGYEHEGVRQAASAGDAASSVGLWVAGADGTLCEKLLHGSFVVEPRGLLVFGAKPGTSAPADEEAVVGWRKLSPLSLAGPGALADLHLPLRPVDHLLPVWAGGDPVRAVGDAFVVRLDPARVRGGGEVLQVEYHPQSGSVYSVGRLPLRRAPSEPATAPATAAEAERVFEIMVGEDEHAAIVCVVTGSVGDRNLKHCLVDPIVFLNVARASVGYDKKQTFAALAKSDGPAFVKGAAFVPAHFAAIAGFLLPTVQ